MAAKLIRAAATALGALLVAAAPAGAAPVPPDATLPATTLAGRTVSAPPPPRLEP